MSTSVNDRNARHALQGVQAATRRFCEIRRQAATATEAREAVERALGQIEAGPAPAAFKEAARAEFARRFVDTYQASLEHSVGQAA